MPARINREGEITKDRRDYKRIRKDKSIKYRHRKNKTFMPQKGWIHRRKDIWKYRDRKTFKADPKSLWRITKRFTCRIW